MNYEKMKEYVKQVWKGVFNKTPEININEDGLFVDNYAICPKELTITRNTIAGKRVCKVNGFELSVTISIPATYWEPEDFREDTLGEDERFEGIVYQLIKNEAIYRADQIIEGIAAHEHWEQERG